MNNKVNFLRGTATEYESSIKDNDTFYYTTDTEKLYLGNKEITGGGVTIDDTLSGTSKNPVQNKVIKAALDEKANLSDIPTSLPANGGNADTAKSVQSPTGKALLFEDNEGGNLRLVSPDNNHAVEMDFYNNSFRMVFRDNDEYILPVEYNSTTKKFNINGNADTLDGKHAAEFVPYHSYAPIYTGDILDITEMGTYSCFASECTNIPAEIASACYITMYQFRDAGYKHYICVPLNALSETQNTIWLASESYKDSNGKLIWNKSCDGGDADTLDGKHASDFIYARGILDNIDLDDIKYPCSALALNCMHSPTSQWGTLLVYAGGTDSIVQIYIPTVPDGTPTAMYFRHYGGTGWTTWRNTADGGNAATANFATHSDYAGGSVQPTASNICLRNLSSGTAAANTTNCPSGAWYGKYS